MENNQKLILGVGAGLLAAYLLYNYRKKHKPSVSPRLPADENIMPVSREIKPIKRGGSSSPSTLRPKGNMLITDLTTGTKATPTISEGAFGGF